MFNSFAIALLAGAVAASYPAADKPSYGKADYKSFSVGAKISSYTSGIAAKVGGYGKSMNERLSKGLGKGSYGGYGSKSSAYSSHGVDHSDEDYDSDHHYEAPKYGVKAEYNTKSYGHTSTYGPFAYQKPKVTYDVYGPKAYLKTEGPKAALSVKAPSKETYTKQAALYYKSAVVANKFKKPEIENYAPKF